jgi:Fic family protein
MRYHNSTQPFNNLPLLPQNQAVENDVDILKKLVTTSRALEAVNGSIRQLAHPQILANTLGLYEARFSCAVDNILIPDELLRLAVPCHLPEHPVAQKILNYNKALWAGYTAIIADGGIGLDTIMSVSGLVDHSVHGFRLPASGKAVYRRSHGTGASELIYTPPRGSAIIEKLMDNLLCYLNRDDLFPTDPLLKMCIAHYQFEAVHPFEDGNGRTGRILNTLYLVHAGLLELPVFSLSAYIAAHRRDYYYHLGVVTKRGEWKSWILFMLDAVEKPALQTRLLISQLNAAMETTLAGAKGKMKWYTAEVNHVIFSQPYIKARHLGDMLNITSRTTLTKYLKGLTAAGILRQVKVGKACFYVNEKLVEILVGMSD